MMRAELKSIHSPDIELDAFWPNDEKSFHFLLQAMIGPEGQDSSDSFDFEVCTPAWLAANRSGLYFGRHLLIMDDYDLAAIEGHLKHLCNRTTGSTWNEIATKLDRYGKWEFEDYQP